MAFGGYSLDPDFYSLLNSGFIYYEDALNGQVLWAKELTSNLNTQQSSVNSIQIDIVNNYVYCSFFLRFQIIKLNGMDGTIVKSMVFNSPGTDYPLINSIHLVIGGGFNELIVHGTDIVMGVRK
jgi:hypothetical protein